MVHEETDLIALWVSVKTYNAVKAHFKSIFELARATDTEILAARNVGPETLREIDQALLKAGFDRSKIIAYFEYVRELQP